LENRTKLGFSHTEHGPRPKRTLLDKQ
jgi:hypothetical protein